LLLGLFTQGWSLLNFLKYKAMLFKRLGPFRHCKKAFYIPRKGNVPV
jgi:hypothetical protein